MLFVLRKRGLVFSGGYIFYKEKCFNIRIRDDDKK